jgi:hypothetical protein
MSASRPSVNVPFAHYALIYLDNTGKLKVAESPSIQEQSRSVFTPEVRERFLEILGSKIGYHKPMIRRMCCEHARLSSWATLAYKVES